MYALVCECVRLWEHLLIPSSAPAIHLLGTDEVSGNVNMSILCIMVLLVIMGL